MNTRTVVYAVIVAAWLLLCFVAGYRVMSPSLDPLWHVLLGGGGGIIVGTCIAVAASLVVAGDKIADAADRAEREEKERQR